MGAKTEKVAWDLVNAMGNLLIVVGNSLRDNHDRPIVNSALLTINMTTGRHLESIEYLKKRRDELIQQMVEAQKGGKK